LVGIVRWWTEAKVLEYLHYLLKFQRAQTEAVTFLGNQESSRSLYAIPGLDYVAHEDILPYTTTEKQPLQHELFDKFLMYYPDKGTNIIAAVLCLDSIFENGRFVT
jgi:hypothetical protein